MISVSHLLHHYLPSIIYFISENTSVIGESLKIQESLRIPKSSSTLVQHHAMSRANQRK
ncbi:hypothetical protein JOC27_001554 [Sporolactobacillus spathodeae]|uniref:Uncharacterized protein n=1 Tax=Sporolactobacillus spathodeae TaxID=1465502 RepID=A0ABS2Q8I8_9BACL|nr:hypothetical protein [Sporolactobacillus spathodeae]